MELLAALKLGWDFLKAVGGSWRWLVNFRVFSVWKDEQRRYSELFDTTVQCQRVFRSLDRKSRAFRAPLGMESPGTEEETKAVSLLKFYLADLDHALNEYQWPAGIVAQFPLIVACKSLQIPVVNALVVADPSEVMLVSRVAGPFTGDQCLHGLIRHEATLLWMQGRGRFSELDRKRKVLEYKKTMPPELRPRRPSV
jgi:hypothetical protein